MVYMHPPSPSDPLSPESKSGSIEPCAPHSDHVEEKDKKDIGNQDSIISRKVLEQIREQSDLPPSDLLQSRATLSVSEPDSKNAVTIFRKIFSSRSIASQAWNLLASNHPHKVLQSINQAFSKLKNLAKTSDSTKNPSSLPLSSPPSASVKDESIYLDQNKLLKGEQGDHPIEATHRDWFMNQAVLLEQMKKADKPTQKKLLLVMLHGYSKAATHAEVITKATGQQTSPLLPQNMRYHRSTDNELLDKVTEAYAQKMGLPKNEIFLIHSPLLKEAIEREMPHPDLDLNIDSPEKFEKLIDKIVEEQIKNKDSNKFSAPPVVIDISKLLISSGIDPKDMTTEVREKMRLYLENKIIDSLKQLPDGPDKPTKTMIMQKLNLHIIAFTQHQGQNVLIQQNLTPSSQGNLTTTLDNTIINNGFRPSPDATKETWLNVADYQDILQELGLPIAELATGKSTTIPTVVENFDTLMEQPAVSKFRALSAENSSPQVKVLSEATHSLLKGLSEYRSPDGKGIDEVYREKGLEDLLQISYFRIMNSMNEAILRKDDFIQFNNQIELMHQEIQCMLAVLEPYDPESLEESVSVKLKDGNPPTVPADLEIAGVQLFPSAMHGLSSVVAGIEKEKGNNNLSIVVLKDSYYESSDSLKGSKAYKFDSLDGGKFSQSGDAAKALDSAPKPVGRFGRRGPIEPPPPPYDLFLCEFRHNISLNKRSYQQENVLEQVKGLIAARRVIGGKQEKVVADKFTVVIDTTLSLEQSEEMRTFLNDATIKEQIQKGALNVVFLRSAQKFDMLGIDNYYGGITTAVNNSEAFPEFNSRMKQTEDQLGGLSYQGLAHLQKYGTPHLDHYREAIIQNTKLLYDQLPPELMASPKYFPLAISTNEDKQKFFLDLKFPTGFHNTASAFGKSLIKFVREEKLPMTWRPSFGFSTSNFVSIPPEHRLDPRVARLTVGLESEATIARYAAFFESVHAVMSEIMAGPGTTEEKDELIAERLSTMTIPPPMSSA